MKYSLLLLALLAVSAQAEVYKSVNAEGQVIYSDVPSTGAERVQMPALPTYTPAPVPAAPGMSPAAPPAAAAVYSALRMTQPEHDETIRSNAGIVNISVSLEPALQIEAGHRVQFYLDGKPQGKPVARLSTSFRNVDRGSHAISAAVLDDSGAELVTSTPVTVHLLRASIQQPNNPLNPDRKEDTGNNNSNGGNSASNAAGAGSGSAGGSASGSGSTGGGSTGTVSHSKGL
ncbi:MAG: DUF4124 domain-containing protein [Pseudomonadota bacterium]